MDAALAGPVSHLGDGAEDQVTAACRLSRAEMSDVARDDRSQRRNIAITAIVAAAVALLFYVLTFLKAWQ